MHPGTLETINGSAALQTYGFWLSWDQTWGFLPADFLGVPESCRISWTPSQPPSRCPGRCRRHAEKGRRVGELCWSTFDSRPHPEPRTKRAFAACVSRVLPRVCSHPSRTTYSHAAARWFSGERAYLFHTDDSGGTGKKNKKTSRETLTALKQVQHALPSFARQYKLLVPPYFCSSKLGILYCTALETLPPKVYSNWARQRAACRGKKHKEK